MHDTRNFRTFDVKSVSSGKNNRDFIKARARRSYDPVNGTGRIKRAGDSLQGQISKRRGTDFSSRAKGQSSSGDNQPSGQDTPRISGLPTPSVTLRPAYDSWIPSDTPPPPPPSDKLTKKK